MKKAFVLLLALAVLGGAVFAEDMAYSLSGNAQLIWGYDLNTENHGFTNTTKAELDMWWVVKQSATKGEEPITGQITIKDFKAGINNGALETSNGSVTAKILFPSDLYLQIASAPSFKVTYAQMFAPVYVDAWEETDDFVPAVATSSGGFTFGKTGDFNFALMFGSTNKHTAAQYEYTPVATTVSGFAGAAQYYYNNVGVWTVVPTGGAIVNGLYGSDPVFTRSGDYADKAANDYHVGATVGYTLGDLATINAKFIYGSFDAKEPVVGLGFEVLSTPIENLDLRLGADFEFTDETAAKGLMDYSFTADYTMPELLSFGAGAYIRLDTEGPDTGALQNPLFNLMGRVSLLAVENLTLDAGIDIFNLLDNADADADAEMLISADASYKAMLDDVNYLKPYLGLGYRPEANDINPVTYLKVGVEAMFFPLTTFTLQYKAGEFADDSYNYAAGTSMGSSAKADKGVITFTTKISF